MTPSLNVLYIDDEPINLMLLKMNFRKDFNVITAGTGEEGLEILKSTNNIHAVISDMKMPGMNGVEFIQKARGLFPDLAYFILTGYDVTNEIAEAMNENIIYACFKKPFDLKEIKHSIESALKI